MKTSGAVYQTNVFDQQNIGATYVHLAGQVMQNYC